MGKIDVLWRDRVRVCLLGCWDGVEPKLQCAGWLGENKKERRMDGLQVQVQYQFTVVHQEKEIVGLTREVGRGKKERNERSRETKREALQLEALGGAWRPRPFPEESRSVG